jgi:murein DD-endopeptidase MepM/ murein hydrolase activator NlpD
MSLGRIIAVAAAALGVLLVLCMGALASCGVSLTGTSLGCDDGQDCPPVDVLAAWDDEQVANAAIIVEVGLRMRVPVWGQVIAVATAMQESSLYNLDHGDRDSLGLFQQRPSQGWGTPEQIMDPVYAAEKFYDALLAVDGWESMPLTEAAQAVQRSAYPDAYAQWTADAVALVAALGGTVADGAWTQPVHAPVVSRFRTPERPTHQGTDLGAARNTIIVAASSGTVSTVACNAYHRHTGQDWGCDRDGNPQLTVGCGWYVDIAHAGNVTTRYCHMQTEPWVRVGDPVVVGQPIGLIGSSGHSSGPHLHFEVHQTGVPVDPQSWMRDHGVPLG